MVDGRSLCEPHEVANEDRAQSGRPKADEREERERVQGPTHVIEQVIASTVDHPGLEDRVIEARRADDLLRGPFGFVVGRAAFWTSAQEAEVHNLGHARRARRVDDGTGATDVHTLVRLRSDLPVDPGKMRDRVAACEGSNERVGLVGRRRDESDPRTKNRWVAPVDAAGDDNNVVPIRKERTGEVATDEACSAGDGDSHGRLAAIRRRCLTCVGQTALRYELRLAMSVSGSSRYRIRFPSRRSLTSSAAFSMARCREIEGAEISKRAPISPAASSLALSSSRIWRLVGSARARKTRAAVRMVTVFS